MPKKPKKRTLKKEQPKWAHNGFQPTDVPCLYRRSGPRGTQYYGRIKRHGKIYMQKLSPEFELAKKALRKWLSDTEQKAATTATQTSEVKLSTWGDFRDRYLRHTELDVSLAEKSKTYRKECVHRIITTWNSGFADDIEKRKITSFTQDECLTWAAFVTGYYVTTYNNTVSTLKHIFDEAVDTGHLLVNPAARLKRVGKLDRKHGNVLGEPGESLTKEEKDDLAFPDDAEDRWYPTRKELRAIIKKMRSYKFGPVQRAADFSELLAYSGCRLSEARRLRWADVEWKKKRLKVNGAKGRITNSTSSTRFVPLFTQLETLLRRLARQRPDRQTTDPILLVKESRGTMQRACEDLKLPRKLDHHDLRHYFASRALLDAKIPEVAEWLGHKDGGALLLRVYRHKMPDNAKKYIKRLSL